MKKIISTINKAKKFKAVSSTFLHNVAMEKRRFAREAPINISDYVRFARSDQDNKKAIQLRVCLITEELAGISPSGGIGAAFLELARTLKSNGIAVDILYCSPAHFGKSGFEDLLRTAVVDICDDIHLLDPGRYTTPDFTPNKISYAIYKWLEERDGIYSFLHFHDYKGLAYYSVLARDQLLGLLFTKILIQVHGPTRWALQANARFFSHAEQIRFDFMEKRASELCDQIVAPSQYILDWINQNEFAELDHSKCRVIKNCLPTISNVETPSLIGGSIKNIVFFGRHEQRKGLRIFCQALKIVEEQIASNEINVVFLGGLGNVNDMPSLIYLDEQSRSWGFDFELKTNLLRDDALAYMKNLASPLVCICSPFENSPYAVAEVMHLGIPLISSNEGGGAELFDDPLYPGLIDMNPKVLAATIAHFIKFGPPPNPKSHETAEEIAEQWVKYHRLVWQEDSGSKYSGFIRDSNRELPLVTVVITHYQRAEKLIDAINSIVLQTYPNIELIIVDDGSTDSETKRLLVEKVEPLVSIIGGVILYQQNAYLGAARNCGLRRAKGQYICFLDDDDIALPNLVEDLFISSKATESDVVIALNTFMPLAERAALKDSFDMSHLASYLPTGGPYALAAIENCIGAATSLYKTESLREIGGYTEVYGVGHEDYELYTKFLARGSSVTICPRILYLYEVGRPSMMSSTSISENFMRNFESYICDTRVKDLVNLVIGQKLEAGARSRIAWTMNSRNAEGLSKVLQSWPDRKASLDSYIELLIAEGREDSPFCTALKKDLSEVS